MPKIKKGFVIRLYPTAEQMQQIRRTAGCARWLYNEIVAVNQKRRDLDPKASLLYGRNGSIPKPVDMTPCGTEI